MTLKNMNMETRTAVLYDLQTCYFPLKKEIQVYISSFLATDVSPRIETMSFFCAGENVLDTLEAI